MAECLLKNNFGVFLIELWIQIAEYCTYKSLKMLKMTCKEWNGENSFLASILLKKKIFTQLENPQPKIGGTNNFLFALDQPNQFFTMRYHEEESRYCRLIIGNAAKAEVIKDYGDAEAFDHCFRLLSTMCKYDQNTILFLSYLQLGHFSLSTSKVVHKVTLERPPKFKTSESKPILNDDIRFQTSIDHEKLLAIPWWETPIVYLHDIFTGKIKGNHS